MTLVVGDSQSTTHPTIAWQVDKEISGGYSVDLIVAKIEGSETPEQAIDKRGKAVKLGKQKLTQYHHSPALVAGGTYAMRARLNYRDGRVYTPISRVRIQDLLQLHVFDNVIINTDFEMILFSGKVLSKTNSVTWVLKEVSCCPTYGGPPYPLPVYDPVTGQVTYPSFPICDWVIPAKRATEVSTGPYAAQGQATVSPTTGTFLINTGVFVTPGDPAKCWILRITDDSNGLSQTYYFKTEIFLDE